MSHVCMKQDAVMLVHVESVVAISGMRSWPMASEREIPLRGSQMALKGI